MTAPKCWLKHILTTASWLLATHRDWTPRLSVNPKTQNGSHTLVIPRWSPNGAESAQRGLTSRHWAKVSEAAHSAIYACHTQLCSTYPQLWAIIYNSCGLVARGCHDGTWPWGECPDRKAIFLSIHPSIPTHEYLACCCKQVDVSNHRVQRTLMGIVMKKEESAFLKTAACFISHISVTLTRWVHLKKKHYVSLENWEAPAKCEMTGISKKSFPVYVAIFSLLRHISMATCKQCPHSPWTVNFLAVTSSSWFILCSADWRHNQAFFYMLW